MLWCTYICNMCRFAHLSHMPFDNATFHNNMFARNYRHQCATYIYILRTASSLHFHWRWWSSDKSLYRTQRNHIRKNSRELTHTILREEQKKNIMFRFLYVVSWRVASQHKYQTTLVLNATTRWIRSVVYATSGASH